MAPAEARQSGELALSRALVIDPDTQRGGKLAAVLARADCDGTVVGTVEDALTVLGASRFDIAFVELDLVDCTGIGAMDLLHRLRSRLIVVITTSCGDWDTYVEAIERGALDYLTRPLKEPEILKLLRQAVHPRIHLDHAA